MNRRTLWRRLRDERGQATLEAILVVPLVLVPVLFGVVTFGELEDTRLVLDAALLPARARPPWMARTTRPSETGSISNCVMADSIPRPHRSA